VYLEKWARLTILEIQKTVYEPTAHSPQPTARLAAFYFLLFICLFAYNLKAQTIPNPRPTVIGKAETTTYYYFNDEGQMDEETGKYYFDNNRGIDAEGQEILKVTVTRSTPVFDHIVQRGEEESTLLPTIFLVPGGGFYVVADEDFVESDSCTGKSVEQLLSDSFNVFVINYETTNDILLAVSLAHICNTSLAHWVKFQQKKASLKSFWSLRKIIRDYTRADSVSKYSIDTTQMILVGHSAGAFLALNYLFLDKSEIPSTICSWQWGWPIGVCDIPATWRNQQWPLPAMKGYMPMSGGSLFNNIFTSNDHTIDENGPLLFMLHGVCDELIPEYVDYVPRKCRLYDHPDSLHVNNIRYTSTTSNAAQKFNLVYGSGYIFQQIWGTMPVRYEQVCEGGHNINNTSITRPYSSQSTSSFVKAGQWNTCDMDNPSGSISTTHLLFDKINDFAQIAFYNNPGPLVSEVAGFDPELPSQFCMDEDYSDIPEITEIHIDGCTLSLTGGEGAIAYGWFIYTTGNPDMILTSTPFLEVDDVPNGTYWVGIAAFNGCDLETYLQQVTFDGCESLRLIQPWTPLPTEQLKGEVKGQYLELISPEPVKATVTLIDIRGAIIGNQHINLHEGINQLNIRTDLPNSGLLIPGMYIIFISTPNGVMS
jgi:hypothetical protein